MGADGDDNPFLRYRHQLDTYAAALAAGWSDDRWVAVVGELDERIRSLDGTGFRLTPVVDLSTPVGAALPTDVGSVLAKVETAGVAGSHKARHLFGTALGLVVAGVPAHRELAIASCGNAALAAATIARALERPLRVFVPETADPVVLAALHDLGARITRSRRSPGVPGDPCVADLAAAVGAGAVPFTVQGRWCPDTFDGGRTLGLELAEQLPAGPPERHHLFVQVGGGALATAVLQGLDRGGAAGRVVLRPVQARAAHPFVAAWERLLEWRRQHPGDPGLDEAGTELEALMVPWPTEPVSVATGILDDVTYDWLGVATWTSRTGGTPVLVDETTFAEAALVASVVEPPPDATGAAGLAGALTAGRAGTLPADDGVVVLLTGVDRGWERAVDGPRRPVALRSPT